MFIQTPAERMPNVLLKDAYSPTACGMRNLACDAEVQTAPGAEEEAAPAHAAGAELNTRPNAAVAVRVWINCVN